MPGRHTWEGKRGEDSVFVGFIWRLSLAVQLGLALQGCTTTLSLRIQLWTQERRNYEVSQEKQGEGTELLSRESQG